MCQECREVGQLWPHDDDYELTEEEFDDLFAAAQRVTLTPGPHSVGVGITRRSYTWVDKEAADAE